jgi:hypothetical protein
METQASKDLASKKLKNLLNARLEAMQTKMEQIKNELCKMNEEANGIRISMFRESPRTADAAGRLMQTTDAMLRAGRSS